MKQKTKTYWNGEPCKAERVKVIVGKSEKPTWWCAKLEGQKFRAIKITQDGYSFYIADELAAWHKIREGMGSFMYSHKSVPVDREIE